MKKQTIVNILGDIKAHNRIFTVRFIKKNKELREINAIPTVHKYVKGTGSEKQTAKYKFDVHGLFQCYELQITKQQQKLMEKQGIIKPKIKGFKTFRVSSVKQIKVGKNIYKF